MLHYSFPPFQNEIKENSHKNRLTKQLFYGANTFHSTAINFKNKKKKRTENSLEKLYTSVGKLYIKINERMRKRSP